MTSSLHDVDGLGYKCATKGMTKRCNDDKSEPINKSSLSSNCSLQLECMKEEWIVIEVSFASVNTVPGFVHTACHALGGGGLSRFMDSLISEIREKFSSWQFLTGVKS